MGIGKWTGQVRAPLLQIYGTYGALSEGVKNCKFIFIQSQ